MKFVSNLFFTDVDFCKPKVIQGLDLNFNLYLLILLLITSLREGRSSDPVNYEKGVEVWY